MNELVVEDQPITRFFCHKCNVEFDNSPLDYMCPHCLEGFIEELGMQVNQEMDCIDLDFQIISRRLPQRQRLSNMLNEIREIADLRTLLDRQMNLSPTRSSSRTPRRNSRRFVGRRRYARPRTRRARRNNLNPPFGNLLDVFNLTEPRRRRRTRATRMGRRNIRPSFENFISNALNSNGTNSWNSHSTIFFDSYVDSDVWEHNVFDDITTQLLDQMDEGPPPMPTHRIIEIPRVFVTSDQVQSKLQCSICWENFELGELVRSLPCEHLYHDSCIRSWLALHATCPICRMSLSEEGVDQTPSLQLQTEQLEQNEHQELSHNLVELSQLILQVQEVIQYANP